LYYLGLCQYTYSTFTGVRLLRRTKLSPILVCYVVPARLHKYTHQFRCDGSVQETNTTAVTSTVLGLFPCHSFVLQKHNDKRLILNDCAIPSTTAAHTGRTFGKLFPAMMARPGTDEASAACHQRLMIILLVLNCDAATDRPFIQLV
jgi:hypothetical protein